jgi:hypothetical protein
MREARIILPHNSKILSVHEWLRRTLVDEFGGYTWTSGTGAWCDERGEVVQEPVWIYDVAVPDCSLLTHSRLHKIAETAAILARQDCVYLRLPSGEVRFVPQPKE